MAQQELNYGAVANDNTGDALRDAMIKIDENFDELYGGNAETLSHGGCGMSGNSTATTISVVGTYYKVAGVTIDNSSANFTHANNKLTYTGTVAKFFRVSVSPLSMISASNNVIVAFLIAKNGTTVGYPMTRKIGTGSDVGAGSLSFDVELAENDFVELYVTNETSATTVTVEDMYMSVTQIS